MPKKRVVCMYMPDGGELGVILLWHPRRKDDPKPIKWVECRGRPFSEWDPDENTPMSHLHDCMYGWHTCVLHQDVVLSLYEGQGDYDAVVSHFHQNDLGEKGLGKVDGNRGSRSESIRLFPR
jgi:hypothetical protein